MIKRITYEDFAEIILNDDFAFSVDCGLPEKYEGEKLKYFATEDEKCICAVRVTPEEAHIMHIESLQKGNGRKMIEYIINMYYEEGERDITLTAYGSQNLVDYYKSVGFETIEPGSKEMVYVGDWKRIVEYLSKKQSLTSWLYSTLIFYKLLGPVQVSIGRSSD